MEQVYYAELMSLWYHHINAPIHIYMVTAQKYRFLFSPSVPPSLQPYSCSYEQLVGPTY